MVSKGTAAGWWPPRVLLSRRSRLYALIVGSFSLILLFTLAFLMENIREAREAATFNVFLEAKGEVGRLDEVLTMAAMAGAATGDPRWQERTTRMFPFSMRHWSGRSLAQSRGEARHCFNIGCKQRSNRFGDASLRTEQGGAIQRSVGASAMDTYRDYKQKYAAEPTTLGVIPAIGMAIAAKLHRLGGARICRGDCHRFFQLHVETGDQFSA